jgi:hypothetical protein
LLAVNLFAFEGVWRFAFAKNSDLPRSTYRRYTPEQQAFLLATLIPVSWPPEPPFYAEPFRLLEEVARDRVAGLAPVPVVVEELAREPEVTVTRVEKDRERIR